MGKDYVKLVPASFFEGMDTVVQCRSIYRMMKTGIIRRNI